MEAEDVNVTRPHGWDQCLHFAEQLKAKEVSGTEMVRVWKNTCQPAVLSGVASQRYKLMCDSLEGTVKPFSVGLDYDSERLCEAVLTVFHALAA